MIVYIICFISSIICAYIAEINFKKNKRRSGITFSIFAILIPSIVAGIRASSVGYDVSVYVDSSFELASSMNSLSTFIEWSYLEVGYSTLVYIISRITNDVHWLYFISEIIIISFVYLTLYKQRKNIPLYLGYATFLCLFYNGTLNLCRQSIAIAIFLYSFYTMKEKKYIRTAILFALALSFHNSAIVALPVYFVILFAQFHISSQIKFLVYFITSIILIACMLNYESVINFLANDLGILSSKYTEYLGNSRFINQELDINIFELIFKFIWLLVGILLIKIEKKEKDITQIYIYCQIIDIIMLIASAKINNIYRIGYYYGLSAMLYLIPNFKKILKKDKTNQRLGSIIIIGLLFAYWFYKYMFLNTFTTNIYESDILKFLN